jgi:UDP-2-acetamido-3-amino-2,3-dideoxy-glucuronate N-acetyltransferase
MVKGTRTHRLFLVSDPRGTLSGGAYPAELPFVPKRYFLISDVPEQTVRGEHAHKACHQFMICARGRVSVGVDDGTNRETYVLDRPEVGLYVPPMVWARQYDYSSDAVLLVLASDAYDPDDYIRDYDEYRQLVG